MDDSGTISIAMEFCEGGSLDGVYREVKNRGGRTGEKVLGKVADGVLNGLTYLHKQKIIHRGELQPHPRSIPAYPSDSLMIGNITRYQTLQYPPLSQRSGEAL